MGQVKIDLLNVDQFVYLDLDTGSSDTFVGKNAVNVTDPTFTDLNANFTTGYADGSTVTAEIYRTNVSVAGLSVTMPVGVSISDNGGIFSPQVDGLMGLSFNSISSIFRQTGISASFVEGMDVANLFSFYLSNSNDGDAGEVTFGGYDATKFSGGITWLAVNENYVPNFQGGVYWAYLIDSTTITIGGSSPMAPINLATANLHNAISDTGTSLMVLPQAVADSINTNIGATYSSDAGVYLVNCGVNTTGTDVVFHINGTAFPIPANIYVMFDYPSGLCFSVFARGAESIGAIIFGDPFLRSCKFESNPSLFDL